MEQRETSTDFLPEGYVHEEVTALDITISRGSITGTFETKQEEPFELTEELYQWIISLCCRSG